MQIWKKRVRQTGEDKRVLWVKQKFQNSKLPIPVCEFFRPQFPTLCTMVLEELLKDGPERWIVFNRKETDKLFRDGRIYVCPENERVSGVFLLSVLSLIGGNCQKGFSVTYVDHQDPTRSDGTRLAIQIGE